MSRKEGICDSDRCDMVGGVGEGIHYTVYGGQSFGSFFTKCVTRKDAIFDTCTGGAEMAFVNF